MLTSNIYIKIFSVRLVSQLQSGLWRSPRGEEAGAGHHQVREDRHEDPPHHPQLCSYRQEAPARLAPSPSLPLRPSDMINSKVRIS